MSRIWHQLSACCVLCLLVLSRSHFLSFSLAHASLLGPPLSYLSSTCPPSFLAPASTRYRFRSVLLVYACLLILCVNAPVAAPFSPCEFEYFWPALALRWGRRHPSIMASCSPTLPCKPIYSPRLIEVCKCRHRPANC